MGDLFADYRPDARGVAAEARIEVLDSARLTECVALAVQREGGTEDEWTETLRRSLDPAGERTTFVAIIDDRVAGYGTVGRFSDGTSESGNAIPDGWYLLGLVVDPPHRRTGVGHQLTAARLHWLRGRTTRAWYFASSANRASIDLHARFGFRRVADDIVVPGVSFTERGQLYVIDLA